MPTANTVSILGAGALGAAYASRFYALDPSCVSLIATGARAERLKRSGLVVNGTPYAIPVITPDDDAPPADLIIVALKHQHLAEGVHDLKNRVGEQTVIMSVMNGLDSEAIIGEVYGPDKVLYTIAVGIDAQRSGNVVNFSKVGMLFFGEADNTVISERVARIQALLARAHIPYTTPIDMIRALWWKFLINVSINPPSAVLRAPYGVFQTSPHAQAITDAAISEVLAIAQAAHINLTRQDQEEWNAVLNTLDPQGKTSMLQDVDAGRETEIDIFAGKVVELGERYGIPTSVNAFLLHAVKVIEQHKE